VDPTQPISQSYRRGPFTECCRERQRGFPFGFHGCVDCPHRPGFAPALDLRVASKEGTTDLRNRCAKTKRHVRCYRERTACTTRNLKNGSETSQFANGHSSIKVAYFEQRLNRTS
jgi:hypothetical protein